MTRSVSINDEQSSAPDGLDKKLGELKKFLGLMSTRIAWPVLCLFSVPANLASFPLATNLKAVGLNATDHLKKYGVSAGAFFLALSFFTNLMDLNKKCNLMLKDIEEIEEKINQIRGSYDGNTEANERLLKRVSDQLPSQLPITNYLCSNFSVISTALFALFTGFITASFFILNELYSNKQSGFVTHQFSNSSATAQFSNSSVPMACYGLITGLLSAAATVKNAFDLANLNKMQGSLRELKVFLATTLEQVQPAVAAPSSTTLSADREGGLVEPLLDRTDAFKK